MQHGLWAPNNIGTARIGPPHLACQMLCRRPSPSSYPQIVTQPCTLVHVTLPWHMPDSSQTPHGFAVHAESWQSDNKVPVLLHAD